MKGYVLKADARFDVVAERLIELNHTIFDDLSNIDKLDFIVLGLKGVDAQGRIISDYYFYEFNDEIFSSLKPGVTFYTGVFCEYLSNKALQYGFNYVAILTEDEVGIANAILTSEAVICHLIKHRDKPLCNALVLVTGFGKCGSDLAMRLKALNCDVVIAMKDKKKWIQANAKGFKTIPLEDVDKDRYDIIVNTIPARVISNDQLGRINIETMLIDIASYPYGFDLNEAIFLGLNACILPSLPSKYAYRYGGEMIAEYICERGKEDGK